VFLLYDREEAWALSPINPDNVSAVLRLRPNVEIVVAVAENDSPPFREQSQHLYQVNEPIALYLTRANAAL